MVKTDQNCAEGDGQGCADILAGTMGTRGWQQVDDGLAKLDGLSIMSRGWQKLDRLRESKALQHADEVNKVGKGKLEHLNDGGRQD